MKFSNYIYCISPLLILVGCAEPKHYSQTTTTYQEPAIAPLTPTGHKNDRIYSESGERASQSPAVVVEPSGSEMTAGDLAIGDAIRRAFESDPILAPSVRQMIVSVHGGTVRLLGPVSSKEDERAVLDKMRSIPGVTAIRDELQLRPTLQ